MAASPLCDLLSVKAVPLQAKAAVMRAMFEYACSMLCVCMCLLSLRSWESSCCASDLGASGVEFVELQVA